MAYNPADLKLPPWIVRLLDRMISLSLPVAANWRISMTRAGVMFAAALAGVWLAALYSGNNLLYLCGSVMTALLTVNLIQSCRILKRIPEISSAIPYFTAGQMQAIRSQLVDDSENATSTLLHLALRITGGEIELDARLTASGSLLLGQVEVDRRGVFRCDHLIASTSAPLGLFLIKRRSSIDLEVVVAPAPIAWQPATAAGADTHSVQGNEGDQWQDLRGYITGDSLRRVHWRKADGDQRNWVVKRFAHANADQKLILRVDLRRAPGEDDSAFEQMLGRARGWIAQHQSESVSVVIGQQRFELDGAGQLDRAIYALAAAAPETVAPAGQGGVLLSLLEQA